MSIPSELWSLPLSTRLLKQSRIKKWFVLIKVPPYFSDFLLRNRKPWPRNIGETEVNRFFSSIREFLVGRSEKEGTHQKLHLFTKRDTHFFVRTHRSVFMYMCMFVREFAWTNSLTGVWQHATHVHPTQMISVISWWWRKFFFLRACTLAGCCQMPESHDKCHFVIPMCAHANTIRGRPLQMCDIKEGKYFQTVKVEPQNDSKRCNQWRNVTTKHSSLPSSFVYTSLQVSSHDRHSATPSYLQ